jgi:hypothetical protein
VRQPRAHAAPAGARGEIVATVAASARNAPPSARSTGASSAKRAPICGLAARTSKGHARVKLHEQHVIWVTPSGGPLGIGTTSCVRMAFPRASIPPLAFVEPTEARLDQIVGGQRRRTRGQQCERSGRSRRGALP